MEYFIEVCYNLKTIIDILSFFVTMYTVCKTLNKNFRHSSSRRITIDLSQGMSLGYPGHNYKDRFYPTSLSESIKTVGTTVTEAYEDLFDKSDMVKGDRVCASNSLETNHKQVSSNKVKPEFDSTFNVISPSNAANVTVNPDIEAYKIIHHKTHEIDILDISEANHSMGSLNKPGPDSHDYFNFISSADSVRAKGLELNKEYEANTLENIDKGETFLNVTSKVSENQYKQTFFNKLESEGNEFDTSVKARDNQICISNLLEANLQQVSSSKVKPDMNDSFNPISLIDSENIGTTVIEAYKMIHQLDISGDLEANCIGVSLSKPDLEIHKNINPNSSTDSVNAKLTRLNEEYEMIALESIPKLEILKNNDTNVIEKQHKQVTFNNLEPEKMQFDTPVKAKDIHISTLSSPETNYQQISFNKVKPDTNDNVNPIALSDSENVKDTPVVEANKLIFDETHQLDISNVPEAINRRNSISKPELVSYDNYNSISPTDSVNDKFTGLHEEFEVASFESIDTGKSFQNNNTKVSDNKHKQVSSSKLESEEDQFDASVKARGDQISTSDSLEINNKQISSSKIVSDFIGSFNSIALIDSENIGSPVIDAYKMIQSETHHLDNSDVLEANMISSSKLELEFHENLTCISSNNSLNDKTTGFNKENIATAFEIIDKGEAFQNGITNISENEHKQVFSSKLEPERVHFDYSTTRDDQICTSNSPETSNKVKPDIDGSFLIDFANTEKVIDTPSDEVYKIIYSETYNLDNSNVPEDSCGGDSSEPDFLDNFNSISHADSVNAKGEVLNKEYEVTTFESVEGEALQNNITEISENQHKQVPSSKLKLEGNRLETFIKTGDNQICTLISVETNHKEVVDAPLAIEANKIIQSVNCINKEALHLDISDIPNANYNGASLSKSEPDSHKNFNSIPPTNTVNAIFTGLNEEYEVTAFGSIPKLRSLNNISNVSENHKQVSYSEVEIDSNNTKRSIPPPDSVDAKDTVNANEEYVITSFETPKEENFEINVACVPRINLNLITFNKSEHESYDSSNFMAPTDKGKTRVNKEYEKTIFGNTFQEKTFQSDTVKISDTYDKHVLSNKLESDFNILNPTSTKSTNSNLSTSVTEVDKVIHPKNYAKEILSKIDAANNIGTSYTQVFSSRPETDSINYLHPISLSDDPCVIALQNNNSHVNETNVLDLGYFRNMLNAFGINRGSDKFLRADEPSHVLKDFRASFKTKSETVSKVAGNYNNECASEDRYAFHPGLGYSTYTDSEFPKLSSVKQVNFKNKHINKHKKSKCKKKIDSSIQAHKMAKDTESELKKTDRTLGQSHIVKNNLPITASNISNESTSAHSNTIDSCSLAIWNTTNAYLVSDSLLKTSDKSYSQIAKVVSNTTTNADSQSKFSKVPLPSSKLCKTPTTSKNKCCKVPSPGKNKSCNVPSPRNIKPCKISSTSNNKNCKVPSTNKTMTCKIQSPRSLMKNVNKEKSRKKILKGSFKSKIISVKETSLTFEGKSEIERATCFLYGVSLSDIFLTNVFKSDQLVEYDIKRKEGVDEYYIGKDVQCPKQKYEKLKEYCRINNIESGTKCSLLHLTGFVPEDCAPIPKMRESIPIIEI